MEKFSNATFFRQIALQNLQHKNLRFSETELIIAITFPIYIAQIPFKYCQKGIQKKLILIVELTRFYNKIQFPSEQKTE